MNELLETRFNLLTMMNGMVIPPAILETTYDMMAEDLFRKGISEQFEKFVKSFLEPENYPFLASYDADAAYYATAGERKEYLLSLIDSQDDAYVKKHRDVLEQAVSEDGKWVEMAFKVYQLLFQNIYYGLNVKRNDQSELSRFCKFACFNQTRPQEGNCMDLLIESLDDWEDDLQHYCIFSVIFCGFGYVTLKSLPKLKEMTEKHKAFLQKQSRIYQSELRRVKFC